MMLLYERYVHSKIFVIVRRFSQKLQAHKLNMIKRERLARHPRTIWRIWACDVTPTSRMLYSQLDLASNKAYVGIETKKPIIQSDSQLVDQFICQPMYEHWRLMCQLARNHKLLDDCSLVNNISICSL